MKKILVILAMLSLLFTMYAEAPEMQKYLPTEWKYMNEYDGPLKKQLADGIEREKRGVDGETFRKECLYAVIEKDDYSALKFGGIYSYYDMTEKKIDLTNKEVFPKPGEYIYYEEELLGCTFYYMIEREKNKDNYPINMFLAYKKGEEFIFYNPVCYKPPKSHNTYGTYGTYFIPRKNHQIKAVCRAFNMVNNKRGVYTSVCYQLLEKQILGKELDASNPVKEVVFSAGSFLYDENNPMRYGLFNAFDGDPSTSFVWDTEEKTCYIQFSGYWDYSFPGGFSEFKIINGYAQNEDLYKKNSRPKVIQGGAKPCSNEYLPSEYVMWAATDDLCYLDDNTLDWQKRKFHIDYFLWASDIYKGTKYSDTCIAELDFKYDGGSTRLYDRKKRKDYEVEIASIGWLFSSEVEDE